MREEPCRNEICRFVPELNLRNFSETHLLGHQNVIKDTSCILRTVSSHSHCHVKINRDVNFKLFTVTSLPGDLPILQVQD